MSDCMCLYTKIDRKGKLSSRHIINARYSNGVDKADYLIPYIRIKVPKNYVFLNDGMYVLLKDIIEDVDMLYPSIVYRSSDGVISPYRDKTWSYQLKMCNYDPYSYIKDIHKSINDLYKILKSNKNYYMWYNSARSDYLFDCREIRQIRQADGQLLIELPQGSVLISYNDIKCLRLYDDNAMSSGLAEAARERFQLYLYGRIRASESGMYNIKSDCLNPLFRINLKDDVLTLYCGRKKLYSVPVEEDVYRGSTLQVLYRIFLPNENGNVWVGGPDHLIGESKLSYVRPKYIDIRNSDALRSVDSYLYGKCNPICLLKNHVSPTYAFEEYDKCLELSTNIIKARSLRDDTTRSMQSAKVVKEVNNDKRNISGGVEFFDGGKYKYVGKSAYLKSILGNDVYDKNVFNIGKDGKSIFILKNENTIEIAYVKEILDIVEETVIGYTTVITHYICGKRREDSAWGDNRYYCVSDDYQYLLSLLLDMVGKRLDLDNWKQELLSKNKYNRFGGYTYIVNSTSYIILGYNTYKVHYNKYSKKMSIVGNKGDVDKNVILRALSTPVISNMRKVGEFVYNVYDVVGNQASSSRRYIGKYDSIEDIIGFSKKMPMSLFHVAVLSLKDSSKKLDTWSMKNGRVIYINGKKVS